MIKVRITIYEIEHEGDEEDALIELQNAGCKAVRVIERAYQDTDGASESMRVELELPEGLSIDQLQSKCENTCF